MTDPIIKAEHRNNCFHVPVALRNDAMQWCHDNKIAAEFHYDAESVDTAVDFATRGRFAEFGDRFAEALYIMPLLLYIADDRQAVLFKTRWC